MQKNTITMKTDWTYNGQRFTPTDVGDYYGFVYRITNLTNGMDYIGRKYFKTIRKLKPLAGFKKNVRSQKKQIGKSIGVKVIDSMKI